MSLDDVSNNLFLNKQLNVTPISSVDTFNNKNDLSFSSRSSFSSKTDDADINLLNSSDVENTSNAATFSTENYNSTSGYGSINAAAAVASAIGQNTFADVPNLDGNNWGVDSVNAPEVWAQGYTGQGVTVAVLDTGVDYNHEDLRNNIWTNANEIAGNGVDDDGNGYVDDNYGWNFSNSDNNTMDGNGHGTHVSGTIAGENNDYGVTGVAYGAKIMPVKVLNDSGSGSYAAIANGIYYAVENGANVINLSLGGKYSNNTLKSAVEYASSRGVIVVMAAGNEGESVPEYPASYANQWGLAVGATDRNDDIADFSNRAGSNPLAYVTAPGVSVYSSVPGNQYAKYTGTSMATPHVAGVVALMLSANRNLTDAQVREIVTQTAGNNTQVANSNFNFDINYFINQFTTQSTSSSFNFGSLIGQFMTKIPENITPANISSLDISSTIQSVISTLTSNNSFLNLDLGSQFRYYESTFSNKSTDGNDDDDTDKPNNNLDVYKIINQLETQLKEYQRYLSRF